MNILATLTSYKALKNEIDNKEKELEEIKKAIIAFMGDKDELVVGQYKATNKDCIRNGIDEKALKELFPEIAEKVAKVTTYKRFSVK